MCSDVNVTLHDMSAKLKQCSPNAQSSFSASNSMDTTKSSFKRVALTPLILIFCPFIQDDPSLAKKATRGATSSGSPILFCGCNPSKNLICCSVFPVLNNSVSMGPGDMVLTVMPLGPSSFARTRLTCSIAPLVAT